MKFHKRKKEDHGTVYEVGREETVRSRLLMSCLSLESTFDILATNKAVRNQIPNGVLHIG